MNAEMRFKDKRLLEALEYIDEKYIDDVFDFLKDPVYSKGGQMKISPFKHWRHYLAAAACLLVLALAMPLFTHLPEIINSFAAGWGEGTEDETTEEVPYLQFSPDLEPISQELVDEINDAFAVYYFGRSHDEYLRGMIEYYGEDNMEKINKSYQLHYKVIRNYDVCSPYFGTINNYVVFSFIGDGGVYGWPDERVIIEGYEFYKETWLYKDGTFHYITDAYEQGLISESHLKQLSIRYQACLKYKKANKLKLLSP